MVGAKRNITVAQKADDGNGLVDGARRDNCQNSNTISATQVADNTKTSSIKCVDISHLKREGGTTIIYATLVFEVSLIENVVQDCINYLVQAIDSKDHLRTNISNKSWDSGI